MVTSTLINGKRPMHTAHSGHRPKKKSVVRECQFWEKTGLLQYRSSPADDRPSLTDHPWKKLNSFLLITYGYKKMKKLPLPARRHMSDFFDSKFRTSYRLCVLQFSFCSSFGPLHPRLTFGFEFQMESFHFPLPACEMRLISHSSCSSHAPHIAQDGRKECACQC